MVIVFLGYGKKSIENESSTNGENQRLLETDTTYTDVSAIVNHCIHNMCLSFMTNSISFRMTRM